MLSSLKFLCGLWQGHHVSIGLRSLTFVLVQHQEHTSFLRFQNDLNESLTPLQFAKALALKQTSAVTMWALLQLLNRLHTEPQKCAALPPIDPRSLGPEPQDYAVIPESWNRTSSGSQSNSATSSGEDPVDLISLSEWSPTFPTCRGKG